MKCIKLIFYIVLIFNCSSIAQFNSNSWVFGDSAGIQFNGINPPTTFTSSVKWRNGVANISDSSGILLYSTLLNNILPINGYVWNKYHQPIPGANLIKGNVWYHAGLFIPEPNNDSILYLFTAGVTSSNPFGLYYSKINYKANSDSGSIIAKNVQLNNFPAFDALMAVQHGNGRDWWLIFQRWYTNFTPTDTFYIYQISPQGISGPTKQSIGSPHSTNLGHLVFSTDGTKFANVSVMGLIEIYNFDRCVGQITSSVSIEMEQATTPIINYASVAFSPDNSKLYVPGYSQTTGPQYLYQFDLNATNIAASKTIIHTFLDPDMGIGNIKLAPDNKIYLAAADENFFVTYPDTLFTTINSYLSVINQPDSLGLACDFQPFSFYLGGARTYYGLPNNPDYELGAWVGSPCDTLTVSITENVEKNDVFFQAWYNQEWNMIHVNASKLKGKSGVLRLFDVEGRVVVERKVDVIAGGYFTGEIAMNGIAAGVYIVSLTTEKDKVQGKILKF